MSTLRAPAGQLSGLNKSAQDSFRRGRKAASGTTLGAEPGSFNLTEPSGVALALLSRRRHRGPGRGNVLGAPRLAGGWDKCPLERPSTAGWTQSWASAVQGGGGLAPAAGTRGKKPRLRATCLSVICCEVRMHLRSESRRVCYTRIANGQLVPKLPFRISRGSAGRARLYPSPAVICGGRRGINY